MKDDELIRAWLADNPVKVVAPVRQEPRKGRQGFRRHRAAKGFRPGGKLS